MKRTMLALLVCLCLLPALTSLTEIAPPNIRFGPLLPRYIDLPRGLKLPVFSGPGEEYVHAQEGKATVSYGSWLETFGREGDWVLVLYGISDQQMRFGYVTGQNLQEIYPDEDLSSLWENSPQVLNQNAVLTDDPLASQSPIAHLTQGSQVRRLLIINEWAYVEARAEESLLRGFVLNAHLFPTSSFDEIRPL